MKDSGLKWVGQIPAGWGLSKVKCHLKLSSALNPGDATVLSLYREYGVIPKNSRDDNHNVTSLDTSKYRLVRKGDFAVNKMKAWQGSLAVSEYEGVVSPAYYVFRFEGAEIEKRYFHYLIRSQTYAQEFRRLSTGIREGQWDLASQDLERTTILLPPLPEQRAIAGRLDELTGRIESESKKIAAEIERLEQYKKSFITEAVCGRVAIVGAGGGNETTGTTATNATETTATRGAQAPNRRVAVVAEVPGVPCRGCRVDRPPCPMKDSGIPWVGQIPEEWGVSPLKHYIDILAGYAFPSHDFDEKGIRLLRGVNVGVGSLRWEETVCWSQPVDAELREFLLKEGDLIVGLDRPWIGGGTRVALVRKEDLPALLLQRVCRIRTRKEIDLRLVFYWLASRAFQNSLEGSTTGVSVPHISPFQVGNFKIAIPPLPEQHAIAAAIEATCAKVDAIVAKRKRQLDRLDALKRSLVYEYVTGKKEVA